MVTLLKVGDTTIELTGWIAYPLLVVIIVACFTALIAMFGALAAMGDG